MIGFIKKGILRALYFWHCLKRICQKIEPGKQLPVFLVIAFFVFFSFQQIKDCKQIVSLPTSSENNNQEIHFQAIQKEEKADFQIASLTRERENDFKIALALNDTAFVAGNSVIEKNIIPTRTEVEKYIVRPNDNPWDIAEKYGLNVYTVLWANDLTYWRSNIKPGDELIILPVDGILHQIKNNEKLSQIANKYKAEIEEIIEINEIENPDSLTVGEELIIPNGSPLPVAPAPKPTPQPTSPKKVSAPAPILTTERSDCNYSDWRNKSCAPNCHRYYWQPGQCTDWVAYKWATELGQCVPPTWGNARTWLTNARNSGFQTGLTLHPGDEGSIVVLKCNNWYGHVAYIESFDDNYIYVTEMNGPSNPSWTQKPAPRTLRRTTAWQNTSQGGWQILGYIYPRK
ncbi:LysM peptidoglycan-binding domain-containing protein [Patescibacteria group bacterium]|nr:LysM peptidoglycan-binding domain-containing protein [Patescibacteria group bacterium]